MAYRYSVRKGVEHIKTKTVIAISAFGLALGGGAMSLAVFGSAHAIVSTDWHIKAGSPIVFSCSSSPYPHTLKTVFQTSSGNLTGTGSYDVNTAYTWDVTGNITNDAIGMLIHYTGLSAGSEYTLTGTIASNGSASGMASGNCQSFTMPAGSFVHQDDNTVVVSPPNMATSLVDVATYPQAWFFYNDQTDGIDNSLGSFVTGPSTPPLGTDSVQISVSGTQRRNLATYQFSGTKLADITELKFSTYNPSDGNGGSVDRSGYLNFNADFDGSDTWQRRLVYVPSQNGSVIQNSWQEWDAIASGTAKWSYSGAFWPVTGQPGTTLKTWAQILSDYPNARVRVTDSWLGVRVGEPYADGYTENIDKLVFGTAVQKTTFNFEKVYPVSGEITNPSTDGTHVVLGTNVNLTAVYNDGDTYNDDAVQWAVRQGTCAANTGTVFGNVDGHTDVASWNGHDFSYNLNTSGFTVGDTYCFVFNPTDDPGQANVRVTREFVIDPVPPVVNTPANKEDCKKDGWKNFTDENGQPFKNQGQCVSWVEHNVLNHGDKDNDADDNSSHLVLSSHTKKTEHHHFYEFWHNWNFHF